MTLQIDGLEVDHAPLPVFERQTMSSGKERLLLDLPQEHEELFFRLVHLLPPPYYLLYVLHTPTGEAEPGRYQSERLSWEQTSSFLKKYNAFFFGDARYDLWVHSPASSQTLIWDRHNRVFVEGSPLAVFIDMLQELGFTEGHVERIGAHYHHYRREFDDDAAAVLAEFDWHRTPLRAEDEQ